MIKSIEGQPSGVQGQKRADLENQTKNNQPATTHCYEYFESIALKFITKSICYFGNKIFFFFKIGQIAATHHLARGKHRACTGAVWHGLLEGQTA